MKYKRNHCIFNDWKIYYYQDLNRLKTFEILQKNWCLEYVGYLVKMLINFCFFPNANIHMCISITTVLPTFVNLFYLFIYFSFISISWRLINLQYCSGFCHTLTWISHGFTCVPHPNPPSRLPPCPIPLHLPSAPALSTCLMHEFKVLWLHFSIASPHFSLHVTAKSSKESFTMLFATAISWCSAYPML